MDGRPPDAPYAGVVVLGMHRSGTSLVTRMVADLGPALDVDLLPARGANPAGLWESRSLVAASNALLAASGYAWWSPPPLPGAAGDRRRWDDDLPVAADARRFRAAHPVEPWVWKDPRACVTLGHWRRAIGRPVLGVLVVRNPLEVATSLLRRNRIPLEVGLALWVRYTRWVLVDAVGLPVLVGTYDGVMADSDAWAGRLGTFLADRGVGGGRSRPDRAPSDRVDGRLRHATFTAADLAATALGPDGAAAYGVVRDLVGVHDPLGPVDLGPEPPWVGELLAAVGPGWPRAWVRGAGGPDGRGGTAGPGAVRTAAHRLRGLLGRRPGPAGG